MLPTTPIKPHSTITMYDTRRISASPALGRMNRWYTSRTTPEAITTRYVLTVAITAPNGAARINPLANDPPV